ncbi:MAG TPA: hypothetical protein VGC57_01930 [Cellulomonas sp.]
MGLLIGGADADIATARTALAEGRYDDAGRAASVAGDVVGSATARGVLVLAAVLVALGAAGATVVVVRRRRGRAAGGTAPWPTTDGSDGTGPGSAPGGPTRGPAGAASATAAPRAVPTAADDPSPRPGA